jgi:hypothetical protein
MTTGGSDSGYNDRTPEPPEDALPKPHIEIIVDGNKVYKPGMKTYFVEDSGEDASISSSLASGAVYTEQVCSCDTVVVHSYAPLRDSGEINGVACTCNSQCSCEAFCTCNSDCSCVSYSSGGGGGTVSCGSPCACVPVH